VSEGLIAAFGAIIGAMITGGFSVYVTRSARPVVYVPFHPGQPSSAPPQAPQPPAFGTEVEAEAPSSGVTATIDPPVTQGPVVIDVPNQAVVVKKRSVAFIIGLVGLVAWLSPIVGVLVGSFGLWLALKHAKMRQIYTHVDWAIRLNIMVLTAAIINFFLGLALQA
jgi:hypothetical protein